MPAVYMKSTIVLYFLLHRNIEDDGT